MSSHDWVCKQGQLPTNDSKYLENMTRVIFQAGLSWKIITTKWPDFQDAFVEFDVNKVANFSEDNLRQLMQNSAIVRNEAKIKATILNALAFQEIASTHGSFHHYLKDLLEKKGVSQTMKTLMKQFNRLGKTSVQIFLWSVGVEVPHPED